MNGQASTSAQLELLVDTSGFRVSDNSDGVIGTGGLLDIRLISYLSEDLRYRPPHSPGDSYDYGILFDDGLSKGIEIVSGSISIFKNAAAPTLASDLVAGPIAVQGRAIYANVSGGTSGTDYQLRWTATASDGSIHGRTGLVLCAITL